MVQVIYCSKGECVLFLELFIGLATRSLLVCCCFPFLFFHSMGWYFGAGVFGLIIIIIIKKYWQYKAGRGRFTPYQSEDPSHTPPTYRGKEEKGKIVEDKIGESN